VCKSRAKIGKKKLNTVGELKVRGRSLQAVHQPLRWDAMAKSAKSALKKMVVKLLCVFVYAAIYDFMMRPLMLQEAGAIHVDLWSPPAEAGPSQACAWSSHSEECSIRRYLGIGLSKCLNGTVIQRKLNKIVFSKDPFSCMCVVLYKKY